LRADAGAAFAGAMVVFKVSVLFVEAWTMARRAIVVTTDFIESFYKIIWFDI